jgi:glycosyltransferase involved in cell wall biosynthesis
MKTILVLIPDFASKGVNYHRMIKPYEALENDGKHLIKFIKDYQGEQGDYLVFNRVCADTPKRHFEIIRIAKMQGLRIVLDLDDYWTLPEGHSLKEYYEENRVGEIIEHTISEVHHVTTTHEYLASKINHKHITIIPNNIDIKESQWRPVEKQWNNMFGWVASAAHMNDLAPIEALARAKAQNVLRRMNLAFCGYNPNSKECNHFFKVMSYEGNHPVYLSPFLEVNKYAESYNELDVALAPLQDNIFNKCKSDLKIIEAGAKCLPIIVSNTYPYSEWPDDLVYKAQNARDFVNHARHIINNKEEAMERAKRLHEYVKKHRNITHTLRILQDLYYTKR